MKLDSKIFDRIRIKPEQERLEEDLHQECQWDGCTRAGTHRAPRGRDHEGEYLNFCIDHVREYNKSYNYFAGMDDDRVRQWQKAATTGHRPTWKMGVNAKAAGVNGEAPGAQASAGYRSYHGAWRRHAQAPRPPKLKPLEANAFETLGLDHSARGNDIKTRYKELVKRHHPDANGGDRSSEDRLRQIIQAYTLLKKAGFC